MGSNYITTPIYYVNSDPHLGHAYTTIVGDILHRFHRVEGHESFFLTGTDEHGAKIAEAAEEAGMDPKPFTDMNSQKFRDLLPVLEAEPSFFIRTTDDGHESFVQDLLQKLHDNDDLYKATYSGPYCQSCEAYYKEDDLVDGNCPIHERPVKEFEETNWFFRLSKYEDKLKEHYARNADFVWPPTRRNEALSFIDQGLEDFSVSRSSITWGVPLPFDPDQVTYVWLDALPNYISALTYAGDEDLTDKYWPATDQLLAKDILRFHAVYWPAILMALGYELPERLIIHGYLMMGDSKMSKTGGNVLDPFEIIDTYGADPLRFYLFREVQFGQDGTVGLDTFEQRYTTELANDFGNLVSRTAAMCAKYLDGGVLPAAPADSEIKTAADEAREAWSKHLSDVLVSDALEDIWKLVRKLNQFVDERAPWVLAKDDANAELLGATMAELAEGIAQVVHMLWPYMPSTSEKVAGIFGIAPDALSSVSWGDTAGHAVEKTKPLFPRIEQPVKA